MLSSSYLKNHNQRDFECWNFDLETCDFDFMRAHEYLRSERS